MDSPCPTTELCAPAEPIVASATPLATNRVRAMVVNDTMVRLIRRASFLQGRGVSSVVRLDSQRPFISNMQQNDESSHALCSFLQLLMSVLRLSPTSSPSVQLP